MTTSLREKFKQEDQIMQQTAFDPFIAMSKLPRHPIMFAIDFDSFAEKFKTIEQKTSGFLFLGVVLCTLYTKQQYLQFQNYVMLIARWLGKKSLKGNYINQTEVEFHRINPETLKFAFPSIIIKHSNTPEIAAKIKETFGLTDVEYEIIKKSTSYTLGTKNLRLHYRKPTTAFENLVSDYTNMILARVKKLVRDSGGEMYFIEPNGTFKEFGSLDIQTIQEQLIALSEPATSSTQTETIKYK